MGVSSTPYRTGGMRLKTQKHRCSTPDSIAAYLLLLLLLGLATFALLPMTARAGSAESVYELEPPSVKHKQAEPEGGSEVPTPTEVSRERTGPATTTPAEDEPESKAHHRSDSTPPSGGDDHGGGGKPSRTTPQKVAHGPQPQAATPKVSRSGIDTGSGASSPVLPILIALVVLAAISIGAVLYREGRAARRPEGYDQQAG